jgi:hypothetical protein
MVFGDRMVPEVIQPFWAALQRGEFITGAPNGDEFRVADAGAGDAARAHAHDLPRGRICREGRTAFGRLFAERSGLRRRRSGAVGWRFRSGRASAAGCETWHRAWVRLPRVPDGSRAILRGYVLTRDGRQWGWQVNRASGGCAALIA